MLANSLSPPPQASPPPSLGHQGSGTRVTPGQAQISLASHPQITLLPARPLHTHTWAQGLGRGHRKGGPISKASDEIRGTFGQRRAWAQLLGRSPGFCIRGGVSSRDCHQTGFSDLSLTPRVPLICSRQGGLLTFTRLL